MAAPRMKMKMNTVYQRLLRRLKISEDAKVVVFNDGAFGIRLRNYTKHYFWNLNENPVYYRSSNDGYWKYFKKNETVSECCRAKKLEQVQDVLNKMKGRRDQDSTADRGRALDSLNQFELIKATAKENK